MRRRHVLTHRISPKPKLEPRSVYEYDIVVRIVGKQRKEKLNAIAINNVLQFLKSDKDTSMASPKIFKVDLDVALTGIVCFAHPSKMILWT